MVSSERPRFVSRTILFEREVRARKVSYSTTRHGTRLVHLHLTDVDAALGDRGAAWSILASTLSPDALLDKYGSEKHSWVLKLGSPNGAPCPHDAKGLSACRRPSRRVTVPRSHIGPHQLQQFHVLPALRWQRRVGLIA